MFPISGQFSGKISKSGYMVARVIVTRPEDIRVPSPLCRPSTPRSLPEFPFAQSGCGAEPVSEDLPKHGAVYAKKLADDLIEQGYCEHQIFHGTGLSAEMLQPDQPVARFDMIASFFERAAELTDDDILGFARGQKREIRRSGLISFVGVSSPSVMSFIRNVAHYRRVFTDAVEVDCDMLEDDGVLKWHFNVPASIIHRQYLEFFASGLLHAMRQAANRKFCPELVTFRHARNANIAEFTRYFGCEVRFGACENSYKFKVDDLALPLMTADDELYKILKNCCEHALQVKSRNIPSLIVEVERAISDRLTRGEATQENVARALGMSPRTLSRRLAEEGMTFFKALDGLRKALALNYLRHSNLMLAEITFLLGYSGLSSFNDAFKRWTGQTPGQYRNT